MWLPSPDFLFPVGRNSVIYYLFAAMELDLLSWRQIWWFVISHYFQSLQWKRRWPLTHWADHSASERYFPGFCPLGTFKKNWPVSEPERFVFTPSLCFIFLSERTQNAVFNGTLPWCQFWADLHNWDTGILYWELQLILALQTTFFFV